jgi:AraC family transcriptional regulator
MLSSATHARWKGLILEKHLAGAEYVRTNFDVYSHLIHIFTGVPVQQEFQIEGRTHRVQNTPGSMMIEPQGLHASVRVRRSQPDIQWILELDPAVVEQRVQESLNDNRFELTPQIDLRDPQLQRLTQALQADAEAGCPAGSLFGETIGAALIIYLAHHYSVHTAGDAAFRGGLPKLRLSRVLDYIHANLDRDIHLDELANIAGLSSFHFAKLFKLSTGTSPHQYMLQRRVERAKELLHDPQMSLTQISLETGFSDQSHLTNVFRRLQGVTPSRYRALL